MSEWRLVKYRGKWAAVSGHGDARKRHSLGTDDRAAAEQKLARLNAPTPTDTTIRALWEAYEAEKEGRAVLETMKYTWRALAPTFGSLSPEHVTVDRCRRHTARRRDAGIKDGTIHTELGHLRMVLLWAAKRGHIDKAPHVDRPSKPLPKDRYLTRAEAWRIIEAANDPHVKIAMRLMLATAGRAAAILELKWARVDIERGVIDLRNPHDRVARKGRATTPMPDWIKPHLEEAKAGAISDFVVEWGGRPVKSLKRGFKTAAEKAGVPDVSPHVFRHTAAVWMAEAGIPMAQISQYLGHNDEKITQRVYARFSPGFLKAAADSTDPGAFGAEGTS